MTPRPSAPADMLGSNACPAGLAVLHGSATVEADCLAEGDEHGCVVRLHMVFPASELGSVECCFDFVTDLAKTHGWHPDDFYNLFRRPDSAYFGQAEGSATAVMEVDADGLPGRWLRYCVSLPGMEPLTFAIELDRELELAMQALMGGAPPASRIELTGETT